MSPWTTWACAHSHESISSGSSATSAVSDGSGRSAVKRSSVRGTTASTSHGRSRAFEPAAAGVSIQGKSGVSNSMLAK